jgi:hypothetical protein
MKISVTIPAIRTGTIADAIASIQRQTHGDWELIVVGQGNDPALPELGRAASQSDPRIRYIHLDKSGTCRARNAGIVAARGDILAFIDDDCVAQDDWLATMAECFEKEPDVEVVGGSLLRPKLARPPLFYACPAIEPTESLYDPKASGRKPPKGWGWIGCNFGMRRSVHAARGGLPRQRLPLRAESRGAQLPQLRMGQRRHGGEARTARRPTRQRVGFLQSTRLPRGLGKPAQAPARRPQLVQAVELHAIVSSLHAQLRHRSHGARSGEKVSLSIDARARKPSQATQANARAYGRASLTPHGSR